MMIKTISQLMENFIECICSCKSILILFPNFEDNKYSFVPSHLRIMNFDILSVDKPVTWETLMQGLSS